MWSEITEKHRFRHTKSWQIVFPHLRGKKKKRKPYFLESLLAVRLLFSFEIFSRIIVSFFRFFHIVVIFLVKRQGKVAYAHANAMFITLLVNNASLHLLNASQFLSWYYMCITKNSGLKSVGHSNKAVWLKLWLFSECQQYATVWKVFIVTAVKPLKCQRPK